MMTEVDEIYPASATSVFQALATPSDSVFT